MSATALPEKECDLVMKGGITSGVVYPGAITRIARTSASGTWAAPRRRDRRGRGSRMRVPAEPGRPGRVRRPRRGAARDQRPGFVQSLFQPTAEAKPAFDLALRLVTTTGSLTQRLLQAGVLILRQDRRFLLGAGLTVLVWLGIAVLAIAALVTGDPSGLEIAAAILLGVAALPLGGLIVAAFAVAAFVRFGTKLDHALQDTWWGMCSGKTEEGKPVDSGLTDWLYQTVQKCAGNPETPLTFRDLVGDEPANADVNLQLITTDLSASRPATLPLPEPTDEEKPYFFDPEEWRRLFPEPVVQHMVDATSGGAVPDPDRGGRMLYPVPGFDLPIVVAARLSLSFPILLSTIPFWRQDGPDRFVQHTMSDGGISSNFPIHYFDSLFPGRPTFGLDLQPWRDESQEFVEMSDDAGRGSPR